MTNSNDTRTVQLRRPARYRVTETGHGVELWLDEDYATNGEPETREFWVHGDAGHVYDTTDAPGTTGRQVCDALFGLGSTQMCHERELPGLVRRLARRHCDAIDRDGSL